jgi:S-adenosylmethionine hydrolase
MPDPLITLTTDFGEDSPYAAALKGVVLGINPSARLLDLSHQVPPQDVRHAAWFLANCLPCFPPDSIHVVVVDPGVGTDRALLLVEAGGRWLLAPDNGCWEPAARRLADTPRVWRLDRPRFWRHPVSATFHGRDVLAPCAAHRSLGVPPDELGTPAAAWARLRWPEPVREAGGITGEVVFIDRFGNLITNVPAELLPPWFTAELTGHSIMRHVRTYAEAPPGTPVTLISSSGDLEIAVNRDSAAAALKAGVGTPVRVLPRREPQP